MWAKDKEKIQAILVIAFVFLAGCMIAMIPKGYALTKFPSSEDTKFAAECTDKELTQRDLTGMAKIDSMKTAIDQGLDVVDYDSMSEEEADAQGYVAYTFADGTRAWFAKHALGSLYAHDDGSLNEYDEGYFVAHSGSAYGVGIAGLYPGAVVTVDGREIVIDGYIYDNYITGDIGRVRDRIGWDKVCFQTCVGNNGDVIIYYGHYTDGSTAAPVHEAREEEYATRWEEHQKYLAENAAQAAKLEAENAEKRAAAEAAAKKAAEERAQWEAQQEAQRAAAEQARAQAEAQAQAQTQVVATQADNCSNSSNSASSASGSKTPVRTANANAA